MAETVAQGGTEGAGAGGGANDSEAWQIEADGFGAGAFAEHDIEAEVFHGGVHDFFDGFGEAMDFVDEEDVAVGQVGEEAG